MGKRILEWLRQRRVAVMYGVLNLLLWGIITCSLLWTKAVMSDHADGGSYAALCMHMVSIVILVMLAPLGILHSDGNERRVLKLLQLFQFAVFGFVFVAVLDIISNATVSFYIGSPGGGIVSCYEALFIWPLFHVGAGFLLVLISQGERRAEMNAVVGGVLIIMGILMPKVLESYSLLRAYCYSGLCSPEESSWSILFEMAIAYAASLSMMFVFGLFVPSIESCLRKFIELAGSHELECFSAATPDSQASVSASGVVSSSGKQSDRVELSSASSSVATGMYQESADGVAIPEKATELLERACGSGGAVPKQLMSAAVSGLIAGACFLVVSRLLGRR